MSDVTPLVNAPTAVLDGAVGGVVNPAVTKHAHDVLTIQKIDSALIVNMISIAFDPSP